MKKDLKQEILEKIKKEQIKPISKGIFIWKNRILWIVIIIVLIFLWITFSFLYNDFLDSKELWDFVWENRIFLLPNIFWLAIIISLLFIVFLNYRKTKYWYKQSNFLLISIIFTLTIFIWSFFIFSNFWRYFQKSLISNSTTLQTYIYKENLWNKPDEWRLIWTIININTNDLKIKDLEWNTWNININNSHIWKNVVLKIDEKIRIIWAKIDENNFNASKVMPYFWEWKWKNN